MQIVKDLLKKIGFYLHGGREKTLFLPPKSISHFQYLTIMKKILIFGCLAIVLVGCQKKAQSGANPDSINKDSTAAKAKIQPLAAMTEDAEEVPIDRALTDTVWHDANEAYIIRETPTRYYVDANRIDIANVAAWMGENDSRIVFPEFYPTLEAHSKITSADAEMYDAVTHVPAANFKEITLTGLKTKLMEPAMGMGITNQYDYCFKVTLTSTGVVMTKNNFEFADAVYSVPLINAIVTNNNLTSPKFSFGTVTVDSVTTTFCKVTTAKGFIGYYDYVTKPKIK